MRLPADAGLLGDEFLRAGWDKECAEGGEVLQSQVTSVDSDWSAEQSWGFETIGGVRYYVRHVIVRNQKGDSEKMRLVYDYQGEVKE